MFATFSSRPGKTDKTTVGTHTNRTPYGSEVIMNVNPSPPNVPPPPPASTSAAPEASSSAASSSGSSGTESSIKFTFNAKTGETYHKPRSEPLPGVGVFRKRPASEEQRNGQSPKRVAAESSNGGSAGPIPVAVEPVVPPPVADGPPEPAKPVCGNKTCHRVLLPNATGTLCERCREKMKKKQAKAKQRFKLEPKKNSIPAKVGASGDGDPPVS
ncbi:hypothetical protein EIP91_009914 [Steccherinum ochraceum]|uniref:Uncharacterized protein n=1 Tax=Steccherinum ochraceum TaxID=92696 RepID=A0A4R0RXC3_9APHY|nr:hypothetical protein EIP91_009914 [Steccherinum ochraceum]